MITLPQPTPGYLVLDPAGKLLGQVERPRSPDLGPGGTVLLKRAMPRLSEQRPDA